MITFQIQLVAKDAKQAIAFRDQLIAAGVLEGMIAPPAIVRAPNASLASVGGNDGPNLANWEAETGKRFRFPSFGRELGWNEMDREANAGKMLAMLQSGEIVRTVSGWKLTGTSEANGDKPSFEIDPDECV